MLENGYLVTPHRAINMLLARAVGGLAILGFVADVLRRRCRPFIAGMLAWIVQAPYVTVTDFVVFRLCSHVNSGSVGAYSSINDYFDH